MKRYTLSFLILLLVPFSLTAQSISVESFRLLENDLTANTQGTMMRDQNGDVAALIRVVTTEKGFVFDGGMMGIVGTKQDVGEILVYVPSGIQKITIKHDELGVLRDYYFPIPVERARTYEMLLSTGRQGPTGRQDEVAAQFVVFSVTPQNAIVTIDNNQYSLQDDGTLSQLLPYGPHTYRVDAAGYLSENGVVEVGKERVLREVNLKSSKATITLDCAMKEADIYLNGNLIGKGSWTGQLDAAMYQVEVKRESHTARTVTITVNPQEEKTITLPLPEPIYGTVSVTSHPIGATVYIDGQEAGTTPFIDNNILIGTRKIQFKKENYSPLTMNAEVKQGQLNSFDVDMIKENKRPSKTNTNETMTGNVDAQTRSNFRSANNIYLGGDYRFGHVTAINAYIGVYWNNFNIECGYLFPRADSRDTWIVRESFELDMVELLYNFKYQSGISAYIGYGIHSGNKFRITPQIGTIFNQISGTCNTISDSDLKTYVVSGSLSARLELTPINHISFIFKPSYDFPSAQGALASKLERSTNFVKDWCGGFSMNIGVELYF